jgi:adenylosuccinate synthase
MSLWVVVGGQFGSEGKGKIAAFITFEEQIDICVRCGGPNSGHSFLDELGQLIMLKQLPTSAYHKRTRLLIPAGGLINPDIVRREIEEFHLDPGRVGIDRKCMIITREDRETETQLDLNARLGSTLTGVGSAVSRRVLRSTDVTLASAAVTEFPWIQPYLTDVSGETNSAINDGKKVLIEGTQGFGLSLYHSPFYPKTTSRDTSAAGFLSEVGLSPLLVSEIVMVMRTFPIRVAGDQAGPLSGELSWEELQRESRSPISLKEYTTVTNRLRRVGRFDLELAKLAVSVNRPTKLAVNFLDHLDFNNRHCERWEFITPATQRFVANVESALQTPVVYCGTGPRWNDCIVRPFADPLISQEHVNTEVRK